MYRCTILILAVALALAGKTHAQTVVYSNITNYNDFGFWGSSTQTIGSNIVSAMVADDVFFATPGAWQLADLHFSVFNGNVENVTARPILRFWDNNGTDGGPGTYLGGLVFDPLTFTGGAATTLFNADLTGETPINIDGSFWAGIAFDNNFGATGATAVQLENLGQGLFGPPTIGTSADHFFVSNEFGDFAGNNPAGGYLDFFGLIPADFGWRFTGIQPVPEPSALLLIGATATAAWFSRRRVVRNS